MPHALLELLPLLLGVALGGALPRAKWSALLPLSVAAGSVAAWGAGELFHRASEAAFCLLLDSGGVLLAAWLTQRVARRIRRTRP